MGYGDENEVVSKRLGQRSVMKQTLHYYGSILDKVKLYFSRVAHSAHRLVSREALHLKKLALSKKCISLSRCFTEPFYKGKTTNYVNSYVKSYEHSAFLLDYRVKDGNPEYDDLEGLANKILGNWKALGRRLLGNHEVVAIDVNKMECFDKAYEMLTQWKRSKGSEATFLVLYNALCHDFVKCRELAEEICCVNVDFQ